MPKATRDMPGKSPRSGRPWTWWTSFIVDFLAQACAFHDVGCPGALQGAPRHRPHASTPGHRGAVSRAPLRYTARSTAQARARFPDEPA
ncbi:hypothetical protein GCM10007164_25340 [Luteimonas padinae]|nr:hypothetical protein GCM10007164_25340 [Luteimonas padinae]